MQQLAKPPFAWRVAKFVKSNVVFATCGVELGVSAGQTSRFDLARTADIKADALACCCRAAGGERRHSHVPRRGPDATVDADACCVIRPGGSMRDHEAIDVANGRGIAMIFTGACHFAIEHAAGAWRQDRGFSASL